MPGSFRLRGPWRRAFAVVVACVLGACGGGTSEPARNADVVAPVLSAFGAVPTTSGASITWTSNEPADSQVEFGTSTAYGSTSPLDSGMVTSHAVVLSGLAAGTTYHYRVRSRDAAGNLGMSPDQTFTTVSAGDPVPPSVSVTAPAANSVVTGSVTLSANASDNVGVVGVTFRVDGVPVGQEDTTSPYSVSWSSTGVANGTHTITATARDAVGNSTTGAPVSVSVNNPVADPVPPSVSVTAPAANSVVTGSVTLSANASDNVGVVGVTFRVDGALVGQEDTTSPYSVSWSSTGVANGTHTITATARDAAGNATTSAPVSVSVNNPPPPTGAAVVVGQAEVDPPTLENIGVALPITSGDTNYNAEVLLSYRKVGETAWQPALPLLRVRPETLSTETPTQFPVGEQFAGSIFGLAPDTDYEVMLDVRDPDGGSTTRTVTARTRPVPAANPAAPRAVAVATLAQLNTAIANAVPGDVITLANGTYSGAITVSRSGTPANPIFIRGASRDGAVIEAAGATYGVTVTGTDVTVENLTVRSSSWGMRIDSPRNVVARNLHITNVSYGIDGRGGSKRDYYICDNLLEGREVQWPKTDSSVWDFEGIVVTGAGHVICHNTISGFGDALGLHHTTSVPNRAIDFYGNDVLWSGDNCVELDFTERNVRAYRNRFTNCGNHSISFQPIWGGPAYAIRNVIYNSATAPYKFNNEPTGIYVLHNTAVRPGWAWQQLGATAANFFYTNNITIGTTNAVDMTTVISLARIDYDGWWPDGQFRFSQTWTSFASLQASSPYEQNGRLLNGLPFATAPAIPATYTTFVQPLDPRLSASTNAIDTGVRLNNINDDFLGAAPDLGALERGATAPPYGVR